MKEAVNPNEPIPIDPTTGRPVRGKGSRGARAARPKDMGGARLPRMNTDRGGSGGGRGSRGPRGSGRGRGRGRGSVLGAAHLQGLADGDVLTNMTNTNTVSLLPQSTLLELGAADASSAVEMPKEHSDAESGDADKETKDDEDDSDEDDDEEAKDVLIEQKTDAEKAEMKALLDAMDADQLHRFEVFRRSRLPKNSVKKIITTILGTTTVPANILIAFAGTGKLFIGDIVEIGRDVMEEWGHEGALSPEHVREAYRRWKLQNQWL
ncbi:hTAFII28-like protein conserved region-domain-containing protein [Obelidium mucronatum]|nr:hTAFII28-like protein conserved region-domain-containing protein [Obelidium mucronatum]